MSSNPHLPPISAVNTLLSWRPLSFALMTALLVLSSGCSIKATDISAGGEGTDSADVLPPDELPEACTGYAFIKTTSDIAAIADCPVFDGYLFIRGDELTSLAGLEGLEEVTGDLFIGYMDELRDVSGLSGLQAVHGALELVDLPEVTSLAGLEALQSAEYVRILNVDGLASLAGLEGLEDVVYINIQDNRSLASLDGLESLERVRENLYIRNNPVLTDMTSLSGIDFSQEGSIWISANASLSILDGPFASTHIAGDVIIDHQHSMTDLDGLSGVVSIGGRLEVKDNGRLVDIDGLRSISSVTEGVEFFYNSALCETDVQAFIDGVSTTSTRTELNHAC